MSTKNADEIEGEYDCLILFSSWTNRAIQITKMQNLRFDSSILVLFNDKDEEGKREYYDKILVKELETRIRNNYWIYGDSSDIEDIVRDIVEVLLNNMLNDPEPLRIVLDISTAPTEYSISLAYHLFFYGIAAEIRFLYSEIEYQQNKDKKYVFTEGKTSIKLIPNLKRPYDQEKGNQIILSLGFEGDKTARIVNRYEPDELVVIFPKPGFKREYEDEAFQRNRELIEMYELINSDRIINAGAGNAIELWKNLSERNLENHRINNISYFNSGTKAHGIGMCLRALTLDEKCRFLYTRPKKYTIHDKVQIIKHWVYDVVDYSSRIFR